MSRVTGEHQLIALDTCVWSYHLEANPDYLELTTGLLAAVVNGECNAVASELTLLELLVRPLQLQRQDVADEYEALLMHFPHLRLAPVSREALNDHIRARSKCFNCRF